MTDSHKQACTGPPETYIGWRVVGDTADCQELHAMIGRFNPPSGKLKV